MAKEAWPPSGLSLIEQQLNRLAAAVAEPLERPVDDQVWLTRFLIVRACGYLEQAVHETLKGHLAERSGGTVRAFALSWLERSRTPSPENLCTLLGRLDLTLREEFEGLLDADDGRVRRELSLLVHRRHHIAHGLNEGLTSMKALSLVNLVRDLADWFIRALDPQPSARAGRTKL